MVAVSALDPARPAATLNIATACVDDVASRRPAACAIVCGDRVVTYAELADAVNRAAGALRWVPGVPGDRLLLALPDSPELVAAFFGAAKAGRIPVAVSPFASAADFAHYAADTGAAGAVVHVSALPRVREVFGGRAGALLVCGAPRSELRMGERSWDQMTAVDPGPIETCPTAADDPAVLVYTSGSTGRQRAAAHSHRNVVTAVANVAQAVFQMGPEDRVLAVPKPSFSFGLGFGMCFPLAVGASTVLNPQAVRLEDVAALMARHRPTILAAVPTFLSALLKASRTWLPVDLSSLRYIVSAGEPLSSALFDGFAARGIEVVDGIGSTEMMSHFVSHRPGRARAGSCGIPVPGCELRLVGEDGAPVPDGEVGTLQVRSDAAFLGYWKARAIATRRPAGSWFETGDTMYRDAGGDYHHCGRRDDMLKVAGMWVAGRDVEQALLTHPAVQQATVTTREDPGGERRLVAYVVCSAAVTRAALLRHAAGRLAEHMLPAAFVFLDTLPLTPNGKVRRGVLPPPHWDGRQGGAMTSQPGA